eukprot:3102084-Amphidinium_carterae.1
MSAKRVSAGLTRLKSKFRSPLQTKDWPWQIAFSPFPEFLRRHIEETLEWSDGIHLCFPAWRQDLEGGPPQISSWWALQAAPKISGGQGGGWITLAKASLIGFAVTLLCCGRR